MDVSVTVVENTSDKLHSLYTWLVAEKELRGLVRLAESSPSQGTLGSAAGGLVVAVSQGGGVLASAIIAWLRYRTSDVVCRVRRPDGTTTEVSGKRVRGADAVMIRELVADLTRSLDEGFGDSGSTRPEDMPPPRK